MSVRPGLDGVRGEQAAPQEHQEADREDSDGLPAGSVHQVASVPSRPESTCPLIVVLRPLILEWSTLTLSEATTLC